MRYFWTVLACALTTASPARCYRDFELANIAMLFMLTVVLLAVQWGPRAGGRRRGLNVLAFDFFFVPPRFTLWCRDIQHLLTFGVMLAVGAIIGQLAGHLRFQARGRRAPRARARTLYEFARDLASCAPPRR